MPRIPRIYLGSLLIGLHLACFTYQLYVGRYLLKDSDRQDIVAAIEGTIAGKTHVDPAVAQKLFTFIRDGTPAQADFAEDLSERELKVLRLLANGMTNAAIADRLHLAEGTVRNHVSSILAKLGVTDRAQATALAWRYGLMTPGE